MNTEDLNIILLKLQLNQSRANLDVRDVRTRPFRGRLETVEIKLKNITINKIPQILALEKMQLEIILEK